MKFHERLKTLRLDRKATQWELANLLGMTDRAFRHYEAGGREPSIAGLIALARYFDVSIDYLVGLSDVPKCEK